MHLQQNNPMQDYGLRTRKQLGIKAGGGLGGQIEHMSVAYPCGNKGDYTLACVSTSYLAGHHREDGARFFSEVNSKIKRGNSHKLKQGKFWLDRR